MAAMAAFGVMMSQVDKQALREAAVTANAFCWGNAYNSNLGTPGNGLMINELPALFCLNKPVGGGENAKSIIKFIAAAPPSTVLALLDENEAQEAEAIGNSVHDLFLRAKALMYQSGGSPIENSLNPIDAWLFEAERAANKHDEPVSPAYKLPAAPQQEEKQL